MSLPAGAFTALSAPLDGFSLRTRREGHRGRDAAGAGGRAKIFGQISPPRLTFARVCPKMFFDRAFCPYILRGVNELGKFIVKYRYIFLAVFVGLLILCGAFIPTMINRVNYDLTSYLPSGYDTNDGYQFLSDTFSIHGDVEAGVYGTRADIAEIAAGIEEVDGVTGVIWADMVEMLLEYGVYEPDESGEFNDDFKLIYSVLTDASAPTMKDGVLDYGDADTTPHNWAVLVTLSYPPSTPEAIEAFGKIEEVLGGVVGEGNFSMSGMTEQANALYETVFDEMWIYLLAAGIVVVVILLVTTNSLMEPLILILTLVVSIVINLGSNALFPSTSIITFAIGAILQLGLSMDYAIFLLHQYRAELKTTLDPKTALSAAIPKSAAAVASSALTTVVGLLALMFMKFEIGFDLGLSLAKGIICSLVTVLFLQPCLMLMLDKARLKTQHKCIDLKCRAPIKRCIRDRKWVGLAFLVLFVPVCYFANTLGYNYVKFMPPSTDTSVKHQMAQTLGNQLMIVVPNSYEYSPAPGATWTETGYLIEENYEFVQRLEKYGAHLETVEYNGETVEVPRISFMLGLYVMFPEGSTVAFDMTDSDGNHIATFNFTLSQLLRFIDAYKDGLLDDIQANMSTLMDIMLDTDGDGLIDAELPDGVGMDMLEHLDEYMSNMDLSSYLDTFSNYVSGGYTMYTVGITYPEIDNESELSFKILDDIKAIANDIFGEGGVAVTNHPNYTPVRCYFTGYTQGAYDFAAVTPTDFAVVTIISVVAILIILIVTLRGIKLPILLVALIEFGIFLNLVMQYIFAGGEINFMSYLIISAVQLGATVDYAILVATKFRKLRERWEPRQAAYKATTSSVMSVLTSALIMAGACFSICFSTTNLIIEEITFLVARGALISALLVIFVLPALLALTDKPSGGENHIMRTPKLRPVRFGKKPRYTPVLETEGAGGADASDITAMTDEDGAEEQKTADAAPSDTTPPQGTITPGSDDPA